MTEPRTNRGIAIKLLTLMVIGTTTMLEVAHSAPVAPRDRPNIIFFINDDQVKEEVGCYGGKVLTPHLDRLAREGMRMDNAHVVSTVCTPSRYSMFTGRYPGNSYCKPYLEEFPKNRHGAPGFNLGLEDDNMNVGNVLRQAGYVTGHVGKLHVGPHLKDPEEYAHYGLYDVSKKRGLLTAKLESQGRPFGEFVPGADSVPAEEIWPYLEKLNQLQRTKKGFEEIDAIPAESNPLSKAERKAAREARKQRKNQN